MSIVQFVLDNSTLIVAVYIPPQFDLKIALNNLKSIITKGHSKKIICGDFNSRNLNDPNNIVTSFFTKHGLISSLGAIKSTTNSATFIDTMYTNIPFSHSEKYLSVTIYHDPLYLPFQI